MVIKGRSRGNGVQLANYLLGSRENDRARLLDIRGTSRPDDLHKSLLEMSLTSELTKGVHGLYHAQINPAIGEDRPMTTEEWTMAADILENHLGFEGQKRAIVLHEKKGRIHGHVVWERYDHETERLRKDGHNYKKHDKAREEIEQVLEHDRTPQREDRQPERERNKSDYKRELSDLWQQFPDAETFVQEAEKAGYQIAVTNSNRPWRVITPDGLDENLVRMLHNADTKDVRKQLQPIRDDLKSVADALEIHREQRKEPEIDPAKSDKSHELSDSQDLAKAMINKIKQEKETDKEQFKGASYGFKFTQEIEQSPALPHDPSPEKQSDKSQELSDEDRQYEEKKAEYRKKLAAMIAEGRRLREAEEAKRKEPGRERTEYEDYDYDR